MPYSSISSDVSIGDIILASDHNDLRDDVLDHDHDGVDFAKVDLSAPNPIGGTTPAAGAFTDITINANSNPDPSDNFELFGDGDRVRVKSWGAGGGSAPIFVGGKSGGSILTPTATENGYLLSGFAGIGYDGAGKTGTAGGILLKATENWEQTKKGNALYFQTTPIGAAAQVQDAKLYSAGLGLAKHLIVGSDTPDNDFWLAVNSGVISDSAGYFNSIFRYYASGSTANTMMGQIWEYRAVGGTGHTGTEMRIGRVVDSSLMGWMAFGSNAGRDIRIGQGSTELVKVSGTGLDLLDSGDYYQRAGVATLQDSRDGHNSRNADGDQSIVTGLGGLKLLMIHAVEKSEDRASLGQCDGGGSSEHVLILDLGTSPSVNYVNGYVVELLSIQATAAISGGTVTLTWTGFSGETVDFSWVALGW